MPKARKIINSVAEDRAFGIDSLLHPALAFDHPDDVVRDADLTLNEKRAILASWASDACAVESAPAFRKITGGKVVSFDDVIDALRTLDAEAAKAKVALQNPFKRRLNRWRYNRSGDGPSGMGLH
jgi:hypothetical protein